MKNYYSLLFICVVALFMSACNSMSSEDYLKNSFYQKEAQLKRLNHLIDSLVIPRLNTDEYNTYIIVDCKAAPGIKANTVCEPLLADLMKELAVTTVNIEKGTCASTGKYNLYIYKVSTKYNDYSKYYYYHDLCDKWKNAKTGKDFIYIPFSDHWSLYVGKN